MSSIIKKIISKSKTFSHLSLLILRLINKKSEKEMERRKRVSLFDYKTLAKPFKVYPKFNIMENNIYGTGKILGNGKLNVNDTLIEHGLILGALVQKHNLYSYASNIVTFSDYRRDFIKKLSKKNIVCIGPYISYVDLILDECTLSKLKENLGRVLLVFPSHSIESITLQYSIPYFCNEIEKIRFDFDTVIVCLYWKDIKDGVDAEYIKRGYKVTTAGYKYDYYFLDRLKTLIYLSDFTMSNSVGTHVGYCVNLNKGHYIFKQNKEIILLEGRKGQVEFNQRREEEWITLNEAVNEIEKAFEDININPTSSQISIVKKYWGENNNIEKT
jgi:hypothetical protein